MNVKELIRELSKYKNDNAKVLITYGTEDEDVLSTGDFECFSDTSEDLGYIEIYIDTKHCAKQL